MGDRASVTLLPQEIEEALDDLYDCARDENRADDKESRAKADAAILSALAARDAELAELQRRIVQDGLGPFAKRGARLALLPARLGAIVLRPAHQVVHEGEQLDGGFSHGGPLSRAGRREAPAARARGSPS